MRSVAGVICKRTKVERRTAFWDLCDGRGKWALPASRRGSDRGADRKSERPQARKLNGRGDTAAGTN
jgi:hypothetical protein